MKPRIYKIEGNWILVFKPHCWAPIRITSRSWNWVLHYLQLAYENGEVDSKMRNA